MLNKLTKTKYQDYTGEHMYSDQTHEDPLYVSRFSPGGTDAMGWAVVAFALLLICLVGVS